MPTSAWIGRANIRRFADGIFQYLATLSLYGAKIGVLIGKKSSMTDAMHRKNEILLYGVSRGAVALGILPSPTPIATKRTCATRIRTADAVQQKEQAWTLSRTDLETTMEWLDGSGGLGRLRH